MGKITTDRDILDTVKNGIKWFFLNLQFVIFTLKSIKIKILTLFKQAFASSLIKVLLYLQRGKMMILFQTFLQVRKEMTYIE